MKTKQKFVLLFLLPLFFISAYAQNTTIGNKKNDQLVNNLLRTEAYKILLIPFDPKLYMSEIDKNIAKESNMNFDQIRNNFRFALDENIFIEFKQRYSIFSLLSDTNKTSLDLNYIYQSIGYKYDVVPKENPSNENNMKKMIGKVTNPLKEKEEDKPKIQNGQLAVEMNSDKRFMNTVISDPNLLTFLNKKYLSDIFIFINELDIKNDLSSSFDINANTYQREVTVHYSIFNKEGKNIHSGVAVTHFSSDLNNPKKIAASCFASVAQTIFSGFSSLVSNVTQIEKQPSKSKTR